MLEWSEITVPLLLSLRVAALATAISFVLGTGAAWLLARRRGIACCD